MSIKQVTALDTISGRVAVVPAFYLGEAYFGDHLVEVPEGTKDYDPEFYKSTDAEGHRNKPVNKAKADRAAKADELDIPDEEATSESKTR